MDISVRKKRESIMPEFDGADQTLDITGDVCPMTFVRTRLALDRLMPGQILEVRLRGTEPAQNVPRSAVEQGHKVLSKIEADDGSVILRLERGGQR
jgi:tRNA 2-thiouridine synthesizing protein A